MLIFSLIKELQSYYQQLLELRLHRSNGLHIIIKAMIKFSQTLELHISD